MVFAELLRNNSNKSMDFQTSFGDGEERTTIFTPGGATGAGASSTFRPPIPVCLSGVPH